MQPMPTATVRPELAASRWKFLTRLQAGRRMGRVIVLLVASMALVALFGFVLTSREAARLNQARMVNREMRLIQIALIDAETGVRGYVLTGRVDYLEPYSAGIAVLNAAAPWLIADFDGFVAAMPGAQGDRAPFSHHVSHLRGVWLSAIEQAGTHGLAAGEAALLDQHAKQLMDEVRSEIGAYIGVRYGEADETQQRIYTEQDWLVILNLLGAAMTVGALIFAFENSIREGNRRERAVRENAEARRQVELLFSMAEMLQSALDRDDANQVLQSSATLLLPDIGGKLYIFNNSRDRLDLSTAWAPGGGPAQLDGVADHVSPSSCWALKRGKIHRNAAASGTLRCAHLQPGQFSLEIPMAARGEVYGLLELTASGEDGEARLSGSSQIAGALADAMSLALSNISLREKLRNQALRDPLTGLYNRRFLEEMLERLRHDAERKRTPLSAIMLDLDHFKKLNDQFGHAAGDAALRQVAGTLLSRLRATDVACRYGGEEIAILLPDCAADMAFAKAEQIREAIAAIAADGQFPPVTCSIGVASIPESCDRGADLLATADAALYAAKQQGRNCVVASPQRVLPKFAVAE